MKELSSSTGKYFKVKGSSAEQERHYVYAGRVFSCRT